MTPTRPVHSALLQPSDGMVLNVAIAICEARTWPGAWARANEVEREAWFRDARAAIAAVASTIVGATT